MLTHIRVLGCYLFGNLCLDVATLFCKKQYNETFKGCCCHYMLMLMNIFLICELSRIKKGKKERNQKYLTLSENKSGSKIRYLCKQTSVWSCGLQRSQNLLYVTHFLRIVFIWMDLLLVLPINIAVNHWKGN